MVVVLQALISQLLFTVVLVVVQLRLVNLVDQVLVEMVRQLLQIFLVRHLVVMELQVLLLEDGFLVAVDQDQLQVI
jgi:hypothetical protein